MKVELLVTLSPTGEGPGMVWWATASSVGNLAVAADSLRELEILGRDAVNEALADGASADNVEIVLTLVDQMPPTAGDDVTVRREGDVSPPPPAGIQGQRRSRELVAA